MGTPAQAGVFAFGDTVGVAAPSREALRITRVSPPARTAVFTDACTHGTAMKSPAGYPQGGEGFLEG
jgi:hypothetical protein